MCAELQGAPEAVVLDFDPQGPIRCRGLLNGKVWVNFIVDTGATHTSIPAAAVESLGIRVDNIRRKARITTANGEKAVPYFILGSLDVSGLVLKDSFALVNDLPPPDEAYGLLGLNFLDKYHYTVDHQSGRMVLRKK
jgi:clan AA aspartic protease (TIGR02281 family)